MYGRNYLVLIRLDENERRVKHEIHGDCGEFRGGAVDGGQRGACTKSKGTNTNSKGEDDEDREDYACFVCGKYRAVREVLGRAAGVSENGGGAGREHAGICDSGERRSRADVSVIRERGQRQCFDRAAGTQG